MYFKKSNEIMKFEEGSMDRDIRKHGSSVLLNQDLQSLIEDDENNHNVKSADENTAELKLTPGNDYSISELEQSGFTCTGEYSSAGGSSERRVYSHVDKGKHFFEKIKETKLRYLF